MRLNAFQIRPTVDLLSPLRWAIEVRDQCVASTGVCSRVSVTTSSTWALVIVHGTPGRCSSTNPCNRRSMNRPRHVPTVAPETPSFAATAVLSDPLALSSTIREHNANR